jgi:hypothetical protein
MQQAVSESQINRGSGPGRARVFSVWKPGWAGSSMEPLSRHYSGQAPEVRPTVVLVASHVLQAYGFDRQRFLQSLKASHATAAFDGSTLLTWRCPISRSSGNGPIEGASRPRPQAAEAYSSETAGLLASSCTRQTRAVHC